MTIGKLTSVIVLTLAASLLVAKDGVQAVDSQETDKIGDLGANFRSVYFNSGQYSPHVGISVNYSKTLLAVVSTVRTGLVPSDLELQLREAVKDSRYWIVETEKLKFHDLFHLVNDIRECSQGTCTFSAAASGSGAKSVVKAVLVSPESPDVTLVLDGTLYFGDEYLLSFDLPRFVDERFPASNQKLARIVHGDTKSKQRTPLRLSSRHDLAIKGSGFPVDVTLLTVKRDENGNVVLDADGNPVLGTARARRFDFDFTYLGFRDPFDGESRRIPKPTMLGYQTGDHISARINDGSIITMRIDATVSEYGLDKESSIAIIFDSLQIHPDLSPDGAAIKSYKLSTQQSLRDTTLLYSFGTRFGDHRAHSRRKESEFQPFAHVKDKIYFEVVAEVGVGFLTGIHDVPKDNRGRGIIMRPRTTLGFSDYLNSPWSVVGEVTLYPLLVPELSGAQDQGLRVAEAVSLALIHRLDKSTETFIKYEFGYNPDARFTLRTPSLNIGIRQKF